MFFVVFVFLFCLFVCFFVVVVFVLFFFFCVCVCFFGGTKAVFETASLKTDILFPVFAQFY